MPSVRILNVDRIAPPHHSYSPPSDTISLSFFDAYWISLLPIQRLFLYPDANLPFPSLLQSLKSSLSETLLLFYPLAGKLTYLPSSGDAIIDCSAAAVADGIAFVEAECDGDIQRLAGDQIHDFETFVRLVPELDALVLPAPVLAVQVTAFAGGGMAIGFSSHHAVTDGKAVWQFVEAWAAACRREGSQAGAGPVHDRAVIRHPRGKEIARRLLKEAAPTLPKTAAPSLSIQDRLRFLRRTFTLSSTAIQSLKHRIIHQSNGPDHVTIPPSTFITISAHAWVSLAQASATNNINNNDSADVSTLIFLADCRSRLDPPIELTYTGNCVRPCYATVTWSELRGARGLERARAEIARAASEWTRDPLSGCEDWVREFKSLPESGRVLVSGSPRFRVYEMDFGCGRPGRVELVSMNREGEVVLVGGLEEGAVQVSVALDPVRMGMFAKVFGCGLV